MVKGEPKKSRKTSTVNTNDEEQISDHLMSYINDRQCSTTSDIKTYLDSRLTIYFNTLESKLKEFVDAKYELLHNREYIEKNKENQTTEENVLQAIEIAISTENIDKNIKKYMNELMKLR